MTTYCYPVHNDGGTLPIYVSGIGVREIITPVRRNCGYPFFQIVFCLNGSGKLVTPEKKMNIHKGSIVFIPARFIHDFVPADNAWQLFTLDLEGSGLQQLLEALKFSKLRCEKLSDPELLVQKLSYIMQTVRDDPGKCTSDCSAKAYDLLMYLHYLLDMTSENADSQKLAQISPVIKYIDMNYRSEMTLEQLSGLIQISPQYLCRLFKDCYKMRPFEYLARKRIQQAKLMLVEDGYSANEVAQLVGYNDCSYFCSVFKKYESISPAEFRTLNCGEEK